MKCCIILSVEHFSIAYINDIGEWNFLFTQFSNWIMKCWLMKCCDILLVEYLSTIYINYIFITPKLFFILQNQYLSYLRQSPLFVCSFEEQSEKQIFSFNIFWAIIRYSTRRLHCSSWYTIHIWLFPPRMME